MEYYKQDERTSKYAGAVAAIIYFAAWLVLMLIVTFSLDVQESNEGILVDFGDSPTSGGSANGAVRIAPANQPVEISSGEMMTQDYEEAPAVASPSTHPSAKPAEKSRPAPTQPTPEPQRQVDQRAMFPGATASASQGTGSGTGTGQGSGNGQGRQGSQFGTDGGDPNGTGMGNIGSGFDLTGRSLKSALPLPNYGPNKSGRVIVDITVNGQGEVIRTAQRVRGSTTNDSQLIKAALAAAKQARFNTVSEDRLQTGTITYDFILK